MPEKISCLLQIATKRFLRLLLGSGDSIIRVNLKSYGMTMPGYNQFPCVGINTTAFIIPEEFIKNGDERLVVLNQIAESLVEEQRGSHVSHVFHYQGHPILRIYNSAWLRARKAAGLDKVRVHDLKHTFGRRLRAAGVSFEDRQDLPGHRSGRIATHYSSAELSNLIAAANTVCDRGQGRPELVVLRRVGNG
jgi:integrase